MKILYISTIHWSALKQRPQYLVELLAKWHKVDYVTFIDWYTIFQVLRKKEKLSNSKINNRNLRIYNLFRLPFSRLRLVFNLNNFIKKCTLAFLILKNKYDFIILMYPLDYLLLPSNTSALIVYDCLDKMDSFVKNNNSILKLMNKTERELVENADLVTCSSEALKSYLNKYREKITVIKNGVDLELFEKISLQNMDTIKQSTSYKLGFIGAIAEWVDIDFIKKIANKMPKMQFYFIGPLISYNSREIENGKNIFYLGVKPHKEVPLLIKNLDICLFPFKISDISKYSNPIKIYEYLALGKPVIARYWPELKKEFGDLIYYYNNEEEFIELINSIFKKETKEKIIERRKFAELNSWSNRIKEFNELLLSVYNKTQ